MLTDTLFRQPRTVRRPAAAEARRRRGARAQHAPAATRRRHERHVPSRRRGNRRRPAAGPRHLRRRRELLAGQPIRRLHRARHGVVSAARRRADGIGRHAARSDPHLDAGAGRRHGHPHRPRRHPRQRARPRQLLARGPRHLRDRPARPAADGRRDVQPARQLEQLSAAQARRQGRRADARRGLLLHASIRRRASASRSSTRTTASRPRIRSATATRCCCRTAITRCRRRPATACITCGAWPASSGSSRCTRIRRTSGSTRRRCSHEEHGSRATDNTDNTDRKTALESSAASACGPSAARPASAKATAVRRSFSEGGSRRARPREH